MNKLILVATVLLAGCAAAMDKTEQVSPSVDRARALGYHPRAWGGESIGEGGQQNPSSGFHPHVGTIGHQLAKRGIFTPPTEQQLLQAAVDANIDLSPAAQMRDPYGTADRLMRQLGHGPSAVTNDAELQAWSPQPSKRAIAR